MWARRNPAYPARISMANLEREWLALGPARFARERLGKSEWPVACSYGHPWGPGQVIVSWTSTAAAIRALTCGGAG